MRVSIPGHNSNPNNYLSTQLEEGETSTPIVPFQRELNTELISVKSDSNKLLGKNGIAYGDSIKANVLRVPIVKDYYKLNSLDNLGIGGTTVADNGIANPFYSQTRLNSLPTNKDFNYGWHKRSRSKRSIR
ncbi:hypothetical protein [Bacillus sp. E214]|uniref:hypothetical protein n=1 Tax=Bacillus sp. E214 TaxID=2587156 RepID=UPI0011E02639|nr:hypothetical protein [Bacillus sp. E214]